VLRIGFTDDDINNGLYVEIPCSQDINPRVSEETESIPVDAEKIKQLCDLTISRKAHIKKRLKTIENKLFGK